MGDLEPGFEIVEKDDEGNIIANVRLRKATLADLLVVADGGDGEIAVCSDVDALVVYDSSSVATVYPRAKAIYRAIGSLTFATVVTGATPTILPMDVTAGYDPLTVIAASVMALPITILPTKTGGGVVAQINVSLNIFAGTAAGSEIYLDIQKQKVSDNSWETILPAVQTYIVPNVALATQVTFSLSTLNLNTTWGDYDHLRVVASHDQAGSIFMLGEFDIALEEV